MSTRSRESPSPAEGASLAEQFFSWHEEEELRFQRCGACGQWVHLPRLHCPRCGSDALAWEKSEGRGHIFSWTRTHQVFDPSYPATPPYVCAIVELAEGPRMMSRILGDDERVCTGAPVSVGFVAAAEGHKLAVFHLDSR